MSKAHSAARPSARHLDQTSWEAASEVVTAWTASGSIGLIRTDIPSISEAATKFFEDAKGRQLHSESIKKLTNVVEKRLLPWCKKMGFRHLKQLDVDALRQFRSTWLDGPLTAYKNLERLRSFLNFCKLAGWVEQNHARTLKPPKLPDKSTKVKVFTADQIAKVIAACDKYPIRNSRTRIYNNRDRIRGFVLALRWSGLRISDNTGLEELHFESGGLSEHAEDWHANLPTISEGGHRGPRENSRTRPLFLLERERQKKSAVSNWRSSGFADCSRSPA